MLRLVPKSTYQDGRALEDNDIDENPPVVLIASVIRTFLHTRNLDGAECGKERRRITVESIAFAPLRVLVGPSYPTGTFGNQLLSDTVFIKTIANAHPPHEHNCQYCEQTERDEL